MTVQADAVDSAMGPVASFLDPGPNAAAQALLNDASLRGLTASELARVVHVRTPDATEAIGSVIGMINATARGSANAALKPEPSLSGAVGPFMSLDSAMSRFGSHMGPIVRTPTPSPLGGPDVGSDRQYGAGMFGGEAGTISSGLDMSTALMLEHVKGMGFGPDQTIRDFQIDANSAGYTPMLVVDGIYGTKTAATAARVVADADSSSTVYGVTVPSGRAPAGGNSYVAPVTTITGTPVSPSSSLQASIGGSRTWLWAGAAAVAAIFLMSQSKHPPKWVRQIVPRHAPRGRRR